MVTGPRARPAAFRSRQFKSGAAERPLASCDLRSRRESANTVLAMALALAEKGGQYNIIKIKNSRPTSFVGRLSCACERMCECELACGFGSLPASLQIEFNG